MAIAFSGNGSNESDHGTGGGMDNLTTATYLVWFKVTNATPTNDLAVAWKGLAASGSRQARVESTLTEANMTIFRATTNLTVSANLSLVAVDEWNFLAFCHDTGGANGDQQVYEGNLSNIVAEVGSYGTQIVGSGAPGDNSSNSQIIGNRETGSRQFDGVLQWVGIWNRVMDLAEIKTQQFRPYVSSGCVLFLPLGLNGTSTQIDYSGAGNDGTLGGTPNLADDAPLPFPWDIQEPYVIAVGGATPHNPLGLPIRGPLGGPIG